MKKILQGLVLEQELLLTTRETPHMNNNRLLKSMTKKSLPASPLDASSDCSTSSRLRTTLSLSQRRGQVSWYLLCPMAKNHQLASPSLWNLLCLSPPRATDINTTTIRTTSLEIRITSQTAGEEEETRSSTRTV